MIRYDTVTHLKWSVNIRNHGIAVVIDYLLSKDWEYDNVEGAEKRTLPPLAEEEDCVVSMISMIYDRMYAYTSMYRTVIIGNMAISRVPLTDRHAGSRIECILY